MSISELLHWQWSGYARYHGSRANLLIHIVVVPLFLLGNIGLVVAVVQRSLLLGVLSLLAMVVSVALQGRGHRQEQNPPRALHRPSQCGLTHLSRAVGHVSTVRCLGRVVSCITPEHRALTLSSSGRLPAGFVRCTMHEPRTQTASRS